MMRVPFSAPLTTIRPEPFARCRSLSDALLACPSGEPKELRSSVRSDPSAVSNIGFHQLVLVAAHPLEQVAAEPDRAAVSWANSKSRQALRAVVGNLHAGDLVERTVRASG